MKRVLFLSPLVAAILFTIPEAWQLMHRPDSNYIPVVFEVLLLLFAYVAAFVINGVVIYPLALLVQMKSSNLIAGIVLGIFVALVGTTIAYAFEIFAYQTSILHPAYLYPLLIPLFVMSVLTFFLLTRAAAVSAIPASNQEKNEAASADADNQ